MQKYEAEIRNHIRIEQQLKIYTESMQEKFDEKEKKLNETITESSYQLKVTYQWIFEKNAIIRILRKTGNNIRKNRRKSVRRI